MGTIFQDIRYAFRMLWKNPGFTAIAVISLALAIGANTAVFSLYNSLVLKSLPVKEPQQLRMVNWVGSFSPYICSGRITSTLDGQGISNTYTYPTYCELRDSCTNLADVFAFLEHHPTIIFQGQAFAADGLMVSGNFFSSLGIKALLGQTIAPQHDKASAEPVAVISYYAWQRYFNRNPNIIGDNIIINNNSFTIIGVLPHNFLGLETGRRKDFYTPIAFQPGVEGLCAIESYDHWWVQVMARIKSGINESKLQNSLQTLFAQVEHRASSREMRILLTDGSRGLSGPLVPLKTKMVKPLFILMALVGIVLLAACANLASLLLARGASRQQEMAVRSALGAGQWRLIRQGLTESLLIALVGAVGGLLFAMGGKQVLFNVLWPSHVIVDISFDITVFSFTLLVCVGSALLFGLIPAWHWSRIQPMVSLKERSSFALSRMRLGKWTVSAQTALALLLLVGAGLFVRTIANLYRVETGYRTNNLLVFSLDGRKADLSDQQLADFYEQVRSAIAALPDVHGAAHSNILMLSGWMNNNEATVPGRSADERISILGLSVSDSFLSTMDISLLLGRDFSATDNEAGQPVILVNQTLARTVFPDQNPIGQTLTIGREYNIVGVFEDIKYVSLKNAPEPTVLYPYHQQSGYSGKRFYEVRTVSNPFSLVPAIRQIISDINPNIPMADIKTQAIQLDESIAQERSFTFSAISLALLVVLLSCIGLFGLIAYQTTQRTSEIGIRMALGAQSHNIGFSVLCDALRLVFIGIVMGIPLVLITSRFIRSYLFGVKPYDTVTLLGALVFLILVSVAAVIVPARRAAKIDPMEALRYE